MDLTLRNDWECEFTPGIIFAIKSLIGFKILSYTHFTHAISLEFVAGLE